MFKKESNGHSRMKSKIHEIIKSVNLRAYWTQYKIKLTSQKKG